MEMKGQFWTAHVEKALEQLPDHLALQHSETNDTWSSANGLNWNWLYLDNVRNTWAEGCKRKKEDLWLAATCPCRDAGKQMKNSCEEYG
jgi:hypothetical protein